MTLIFEGEFDPDHLVLNQILIDLKYVFQTSLIPIIKIDHESQVFDEFARECVRLNTFCNERNGSWMDLTISRHRMIFKFQDHNGTLLSIAFYRNNKTKMQLFIPHSWISPNNKLYEGLTKILIPKFITIEYDKVRIRPIEFDNTLLPIPEWALDQQSNWYFNSDRAELIMIRAGYHPDNIPGYLFAWRNGDGDVIVVKFDMALKNRFAFISSYAYSLPRDDEWLSWREVCSRLKDIAKTRQRKFKLIGIAKSNDKSNDSEDRFVIFRYLSDVTNRQWKMDHRAVWELDSNTTLTHIPTDDLRNHNGDVIISLSEDKNQIIFDENGDDLITFDDQGITFTEHYFVEV